MLRKAGYESKVMYIVPNLPSPLFATLLPTPKPVKPDPLPTVKTGPGVTVGKGARRRGSTKTEKIDDDAVLEPSY